MSNEPNWLTFFEDRERLWADYYLDFAEQNARRDREAYDRLEEESGNLLRVVDWLGEHDEAEGILKLAAALWKESDFIRSRGFMQRGVPLLERAREVTRQLGDLEAEFVWVEALAHIQYSMGNHELAKLLYEKVLTLAQDIGDLQIQAQAQLGMGRLLMDMGQLEQAATSLKQALQDYRQAQGYEGEVKTLTGLGDLLSLQGNFAEAATYLNYGLRLTQNQQDFSGEMTVRYCLGYAAALAQDWPQAILHFEAATNMASLKGDRFFEVRGLHNLGEAWLELGDIDRAIDLLEEALSRQMSIDDILTRAFTHFYLAKAYHTLNDPAKSLAQLYEIYPYLLETRGAPIAQALAAESAWIMADNHFKQGNIDLAQFALQDVLSLAPDHMLEIRQNAEILLEALANKVTMDRSAG